MATTKRDVIPILNIQNAEFTHQYQLGAYCGQVFPMTQEEQERIQEEDRQFLAEYEAEQAKASQERKRQQEPEQERAPEPFPLAAFQARSRGFLLNTEYL